MPADCHCSPHTGASFFELHAHIVRAKPSSRLKMQYVRLQTVSPARPSWQRCPVGRGHLLRTRERGATGDSAGGAWQQAWAGDWYVVATKPRGSSILCNRSILPLSPCVQDTIFGHDTRVSVTGNSSAGSRA